jgi:Raf kinase inhibitor-like YbhB/YbcL family protein
MITHRRWIPRAAVGLMLALAVLATWVAKRRREAGAGFASGPVGTLAVSSPDFLDGGPIPATFTCDGSNVSPALGISGVPATAKSIIITVADLDAPIGFVHWIVFNVPPDVREIPKAAGSTPGPLGGAHQGQNDFDQLRYGGPCPPLGTHRYVFRVSAVDAMLDLPEGATKRQLAAAARNRVLAEGQIIGRYRHRS